MSEWSSTMRNTSAQKLFISYLIPSVFGMMLMSVNILVDGIFVSHGVGPHALAAVNIAVPVYSMLLSISLWIGIGGATLYSIEAGKGEFRRAQGIFSQAIAWAVLIIGCLILISVWFERQLAISFGANAEILPAVLDYLHVILVFGLIYVLENILSIFIRNDGNPRLAMAGLLVNAVLNIVFNYLFIFVWGWGIKGAAYATVLATFIGFFVLCLHFLRRQSQLRLVRFRLKPALLKEMLGIGLPSFIAEGSSVVMIVGFNIAFMHFAGNLGITAFAAVNYLHAVFLMLFIAIGSSIQPLVSYHYGARLLERTRLFLKYAVWTGIVLGLLIFLFCSFYGEWIAFLFGISSGAVLDFTVKGIGLFALGYVFLAYNMVCAEYYQSIKQIRLATAIILMRSIILFIPLLLMMPSLFGKTAIWLVYPVAECLTAVILFALRWKRNEAFARSKHVQQ